MRNYVKGMETIVGMPKKADKIDENYIELKIFLKINLIIWELKDII